MNTIDRLLEGSIDLHMHVGPDLPHEPRLQRRVDALEAATLARAAGQRAIVFKSHQYLTAPLATIVSKVVPDITLLGAMALNETVGGLNPRAVALAGDLGTRIVWFPTIDSANHKRIMKSSEPGITLLDEAGKLKPPVLDILDLIKKHNMVMATGHITAAEAIPLVEEARRRGITRIIGTHPHSLYSGFTDKEALDLADRGALIEFTLTSYMPPYATETPVAMIEQIKAVRPERAIITTDFGQIANPPPSEGMRLFIATLLARGIPEDDVELMAQTNPARLVGLE